MTTYDFNPTTGALNVAGTTVSFADVPGARAVRVVITGVSGTFYGARVASLGEIEVIARGSGGGVLTGLPARPTNVRIVPQ